MSILASSQCQDTPSRISVGHDAFLRANSEAYEYLVEKILAIDRSTDVEGVLRHIERAAQFAVESYPGRLADGAIENLALQIGAELDTSAVGKQSFSLPPAPYAGRRRILQVVTAVSDIGGHTRMLHYWIGKDRSSCHSLVLLNQGKAPIPRWLSEAVRTSGGTVIVFPPESPLCQKAVWLREIARQKIDLVIVHHFGSDSVPTIAFSVPECPPVAVLNHADHLFWMGSSVADMVINLRSAGAAYTRTRRFVSRNYTLPVPLIYRAAERSPAAARKALGIGQDQVVLLSIGRPEKYCPSGPYDFVATANKILERQLNAHMYVVGESLSGIIPHLRQKPHARLHFVGAVEDLSLYRAAADIYLESFPFGSQTALLESALSGLPVVPAYAPLFPLLVANDDALNDILVNPRDEQEYISRTERLIQQPEYRVSFGAALRTCLQGEHVGDGWLTRLAEMYKETDHLQHHPRPIPKSPCHMTDADINLSHWHVMAGRTYATNAQDYTEAVVFHAAFAFKAVGDYGRARRYGWRAVQRSPGRWSAWRLLLVVLLGKGRLIRWLKVFRSRFRRSNLR
jgi:glycosyltransferase involved in cell wall biosynthesis